jgi:hypothetical protein
VISPEEEEEEEKGKATGTYLHSFSIQSLFQSEVSK